MTWQLIKYQVIQCLDTRSSKKSHQVSGKNKISYSLLNYHPGTPNYHQSTIHRSLQWRPFQSCLFRILLIHFITVTIGFSNSFGLHLIHPVGQLSTSSCLWSFDEIFPTNLHNKVPIMTIKSLIFQEMTLLLWWFMCYKTLLYFNKPHRKTQPSYCLGHQSSPFLHHILHLHCAGDWTLFGGSREDYDPYFNYFSFIS